MSGERVPVLPPDHYVSRAAVRSDPSWLKHCGDVIVHVRIGPTYHQNCWMWASKIREMSLDELGARCSSSRILSGRWPLKEAFRKTAYLERIHPMPECEFHAAQPITLKPCPLCGHSADFRDPEHGEYWGSWIKRVVCSSSHCRCSVSTPHGREVDEGTAEERLALMWNRRMRCEPLPGGDVCAPITTEPLR